MRIAWQLSYQVPSIIFGCLFALSDRAMAQTAPDLVIPAVPPAAALPLPQPGAASVSDIAGTPAIAQADTQAQNQGKTPVQLGNPPIAPPEVMVQPESLSPAVPTNPLPIPASPIAPDRPEPVIEPVPAPPVPAVPAAPTVLIRRINVTGSTVFSAAELTSIVQPFEGQTLTFEQIQGIADRVTQRYLQAGYLTSRAVLQAQTVDDGQLTIQIREGSLESVEILGTKRLSTDYIRKQIQRGIQVPLHQAKLEDQLRLLKLDPLLENVEAALRQGTQPGQSVLTVRVAEAPAIFGSVTIDNDLVPAVGSERSLLTFGYRNPSGVGDRLYASYARSFTGGAHLWDIGYQYPLNPMQGSLNLRLAPSRYRITNGPFKDLDVGGRAGYYDLSVRQPIVRSPRQELALTLGLGHRTGKTLVSDFLVDESVTTVMRFGQEWLKRDPKGYWLANSQFNFGLPWLGANTDREPDGQFFSWNGGLTRSQRLSPDHTLQFQLNWQLTPDALPPTQQFTIGGRQSLRGYRQSLRSADNGFSFSLEHQMTLQRNAAGVSVLQLTPFAEIGAVWNAAQNDTPRPTQNFLAAIGAGLRWQPTERWELRLDYGLPLVRVNDRGSNLQDTALYFGAKYNF